MGACGVDFNCAVCAEISGVNVWDQWLEPDLKKQNALTLLTCARAVRFQKNQKGVRFAPKVKRGQNELLTHTPLLTPILLLLSIAKTLIMPKSQKVAKGRVSNGKATGLG